MLYFTVNIFTSCLTFYTFNSGNDKVELTIRDEINKLKVESDKFVVNEITSSDRTFNETELCTPISGTHLSCMTTSKFGRKEKSISIIYYISFSQFKKFV